MGVDGLDSARGVAISPDGAHVYVAALLDSSLAAWARDAMTGALTLIEVEKDGVAGVDGLAGAHDVALSGGGEHVYVASRSEDAVAVFSRNAVNGQLNFLEFEKDGVGPVDGLDGAEGVAVSDDDEHVYVAANVDDAVAVFKREDNSGSVDFGKLTFIEAKKDGVGGVDGLDGAGDVTLDSNGQSVYVASERTSGGGDWAAVFSRETNPVSIDFGKLTLVEDLQESDFGTGSTGIFVGCMGVGPDNSGVAVTPDDSQVYLTNSFRGTVAVFDRSGGDGSLTLADSNCDLTFGLDGLAGTVGIAFDSDGERAYTVAPSFEAMAVLCTESGGCWI